MDTSRRSLLGLGAVGSILMVTACGGQPAAQGSPSSTAAATPSAAAAAPSPTPSPSWSGQAGWPTPTSDTVTSKALSVPDDWPSELYLPDAEITANYARAVRCEHYVAYSIDLAPMKATFAWYQGHFPLKEKKGSLDAVATQPDATAFWTFDGGQYGDVVVSAIKPAQDYKDYQAGKPRRYAMEIILGVGRGSR